MQVVYKTSRFLKKGAGGARKFGVKFGRKGYVASMTHHEQIQVKNVHLT